MGAATLYGCMILSESTYPIQFRGGHDIFGPIPTVLRNWYVDVYKVVPPPVMFVGL